MTAEPQTKIKDSDEDVVLDALRCLPWHPLESHKLFHYCFCSALFNLSSNASETKLGEKETLKKKRF